MTRNINGKQLGKIILALTLYVNCTSFATAQTTQKSDPLSDEIAAIKARGEPWELADLIPAPVFLEKNAAMIYLQTIQNLSLSKEESELIADCNKLPLSAENATKLGAILKREADALKNMQKAAEMHDANWGLEFEKPTMDMIAKSIPWQSLRQLVNLTRAAALRAHERADDQDALMKIRSIFGVGRAVRKIPALLPMVAATAFECVGPLTLQEIIPDLKVGEDGVHREDIIAMIHFLLDEQEMWTDHTRQFWGERSLMYVLSTQVQKMDLSDHLAAEMYAGTLKYLGQVALARNFPQAHAALPPEIEHPTMPTTDDEKLKAAQMLLMMNIGPGINRGELLFFRMIAERRMAAVALAIRLYAAEHKEQYPPDLQTLVNQKYLPMIPVDPMAAEGVIQYLPKADFPRLYSVGDDGKDDGGSIKMKYPRESFRRYSVPDLVYFLVRPVWPPAPEPITPYPATSPYGRR